MIEADLDDAVAELVEPGMTVFLDSTAMAAARSLAKVFAGRSVGLTVVVPRAGMVGPVLVEGGVVARVISGGLLNSHLGRIPPPSVQTAYGSGAVRFELLTLQTIGLRLMAGAMNWPFIPCRSMAGSDLEKAFPDIIQRIADPFSAKEATVLAPLVSDIAIGHAVIADRHGRSVFPDANDHGGWGLLATHRGVILVAEAVTDELPDVTSQPSGVPASQVLRVCAAERAAHPYAFPGRFPPFVEAYPVDADAITTPVGPAEDSSPTVHPVFRPRRAAGGEGRDLSTAESVFLAGSEVVRRVLDRGLRSVLEGSGKAKAVTDYAVSVLSASGVQLDRVGGIGGLKDQGIGQNPVTAYGYLLGGPGRRAIGCISALQVDCLGNINNTRLSDGPTMLVGSGGANDAAASCDELIVLTSGHPSTALHRVEFITVPGSKVTAVVAGRCVFSRNSDGVMELVRVLGPVTEDADALLQRAAELGWVIRDEPAILASPGPAELDRINTILERSR